PQNEADFGFGTLGAYVLELSARTLSSGNLVDSGTVARPAQVTAPLSRNAAISPGLYPSSISQRSVSWPRMGGAAGAENSSSSRNPGRVTRSAWPARCFS